MPVPSTSILIEKTKSYYKQQLGAEGKEYMELLFGKIVSAWDKWQKSIKFGKIIVNGAGVGGFSGIGNGGQMIGNPFILEPFSFRNNSAQQLQFTKALASALRAKFTPFPASFKFSGIQYTGASGASPVSGGPIQASNVTVSLKLAGQGTPPTGLAVMWQSQLTPPEFQLNNPQAKSNYFLEAVSKAIETTFVQNWLAQTLIDGNSLMTGGAPGGVVAGAPSESNGKLI